tara:strand:+ start:2705 stop:4027 length:1323 start_codon:yes stop_codon:yes gene_type:complete
VFQWHTKKKAHAQRFKDLTQVLSANVLLQEEKRQTLVAKIQQQSMLAPPQYDTFAQTLLDNVANYYQLLPEVMNNYYTQAGGMLNYALNRTEIALELFKQFIVQEDNLSVSESQMLWQYALFSAALLKGIGKLQTELTVQVHDGHGLYLKPWLPLIESLPKVGAFYGYSHQEEGDALLRTRVNALLARSVMPDNGFAWIASDAQVLAVWLALLNDDVHRAGTLGAILIRADALAIQRYLYQLYMNVAAKKTAHHRLNAFTERASNTTLELNTGIEFSQWLTKSLSEGTLMVNQPPLLGVPGGVLLCPDVFKLFVQHHPQFNSWQAVQKGFLALQLHQTNAEGQVMHRVNQPNGQPMLSGVLCRDYAVLLPNEVACYDEAQAKPVSLSAVALIHQKECMHDTGLSHTDVAQTLTHLTREGFWAPVLSSAPSSGLNPQLSAQ